MPKQYKKFYRVILQTQPFDCYKTCWFDILEDAEEFRQKHSKDCSPIRTVCAYSKERIKLLEQQVKKGNKQCLR